MRLVRVATLCVAASVVAGCTTVRTMPDVHRTERDQALTGVPYNLPMRQYAVQITRTLKTCDDESKPLDERELKFDVKVAAEPTLVAGERYVVDYRALGSIVKTSDFSMEVYSNGALKSVNVSADDKSDEVLKGIVKTGLTVASVGLGGGAPAALLNTKALLPETKDTRVGDETEARAVRCKTSTRLLLADAKAKKQTLKDRTEDLRSANKRVEDLALAGAITDAQKQKLLDLLKYQDKKVTELEAAKTAYADALDEISTVETLAWPSDFGDGGAKPFEVPIGGPQREKLAKLFETYEIKLSGAAQACASAAVTVETCIEPKVTIFGRLEARFPLVEDCAADDERFGCRQEFDKAPPNAPPRDATPAQQAQYRQALLAYRATRSVDSRDLNPDKGLFVRPPEPGRLLVCVGEKDCAVGAAEMAFTGEWIAVPQLGQLRRLPFRNRMFENNLLVAQLSEDGTLQKFQYASKAAALARAVDVASSAAAQYQTARKDAREEIAAQRAERVAVITQQITEITKQKELDALQNPKTPEPDPMKEAQLQLLQSQAQLMNAQAELARRTTP